MSRFIGGEFPAAEYDQIQEAGFRVLRSAGMPGPAVDIYEYAQNRSSLDLSFKPPVDAQRAIKARVLEPIRKFFDETFRVEQHVYLPDWLHMTVQQILTAETPLNFVPGAEQVGYMKSLDKEQRYTAVCEELLADFPATEIQYSRLLRAPGQFPSFMIGGILPDNRLANLRAAIDEELDKHGLPYFRPRDSKIAHMTVMRDRKNGRIGPDDAQRVIDFVLGLDGQEIWAGEINQVRLAVGEYFMRPERIRMINTFDLILTC